MGVGKKAAGLFTNIMMSCFPFYCTNTERQRERIYLREISFCDSMVYA